LRATSLERIRRLNLPGILLAKVELARNSISCDSISIYTPELEAGGVTADY
jgi:hypothetical protein